jgi:hypothetical protein
MNPPEAGSGPLIWQLSCSILRSGLSAGALFWISVRRATSTIFEDVEFVRDAFELAKGWLLE